MTPRIIVPTVPCPADRAAVLAPLRAFNGPHVGEGGYDPVAVLLAGDDGATVGGLWGNVHCDWLFVELLWVPEGHRGTGLGTDLVRRAEAIARARGCVGLWLDTYDWQARPFYEKNGFAVFGTLDDQPVGCRRFFMSKRF